MQEGIKQLFDPQDQINVPLIFDLEICCRSPSLHALPEADMLIAQGMDWPCMMGFLSK